MARIRSIKPGFFASETIAALSLPARLTFVGLWTHADDYGRAVDNPKLIKAAVWPLDDDITSADVAGHLEELAALGRICRYQTAGKRYLHVTTWTEHQHPKNPSENPLPECPLEQHGGPDPGHGGGATVDALPQPYSSPTPGQGQDEPSPTPALPPVVGVGVGEGGRRGEGECEGEPSAPTPAASPPDAVGPDRADATPSPPAEVISLTDREALRLCNLLADEIHAWSGERKPVGKRWLSAARLLLTKDGYTADQVEYLIRWATQHEFWRSNILSMPKLREKRLTLVGQLQRDRGGGPGRNGGALDYIREQIALEQGGAP